MYSIFFARRCLTSLSPPMVELLLPNDNTKYVRVAQSYLQQIAQEVNFPVYVLFLFTREVVFNQQNAHLWAEENLHGVRNHMAKHRFAVNVWTSLAGNCLVR